MQDGTANITVTTRGEAYLNTVEGPGSLVQLPSGSLAYSPAASNVGCVFFSFSSNYSTVDAYLSLYSDLQSQLLPSGTFNASAAKRINGSSFVAVREGSSFLKVRGGDMCKLSL